LQARQVLFEVGIGPCFSASTSTMPTSAATSSADPSLSRSWCVMRCGALMAKLKSSGTSSAHVCTSFAEGMR
jgi:hypothetical protein